MDNKENIDKKNIEIWDDLVYIKDLILALVICLATTFGAYFIAPNDPPKPLFFGLIGAILGFIISSAIIKPKRELLDEGGNR